MHLHTSIGKSYGPTAFPDFCRPWKKNARGRLHTSRGGEKKRGNSYYFSLITKLQRSLTALKITMNSTSADKQGRTGSRLLPIYFIWVRCRVAVDVDDVSVDQNDPPVLGFKYRNNCVQNLNLAIV